MSPYSELFVRVVNKYHFSGLDEAKDHLFGPLPIEDSSSAHRQPKSYLHLTLDVEILFGPCKNEESLFGLHADDGVIELKLLN